MMPKVVASIPELVAAARERRDELNITHQRIDTIAGLADGYTSKLLAPTPIKGFGERSLKSVLRALALRIAVVIIEEDPEQRARMERRWVQRKRPQRKHSSPPQSGALLGKRSDDTLTESKEIDHEA